LRISFFDTIINKVEIEFVPVVIFIEDGKVIDTYEYDDGNFVEEITNLIEKVTSSG